MPVPTLSEIPTNPSNCLPRVITVDDSCGCTLTRATIRAMTPQDFQDQGSREVQMDRIIAQMKEARLTGVPERALDDLVTSRMAPIKTQKVVNGSVIAPFIEVPQQHTVNANYFNIETGVVNPNHGIGNVPDSAWDFTIVVTSSPWATPLENIERWFMPGSYINVFNVDPVTGVSYRLQYRVFASANADALGVSKALVTAVPNYSAAGWAALTGAQKAVYQTTHGLVINLGNSVSNYESYCINGPAVNTLKLLVYWLQTLRKTFCYNDEYIKALQAPLTSEFFKKFRTLELAKQRKQQELFEMKKRMNSVFYGQRINEHQAVETYRDLPQVPDPANPSCILEYKSNCLGFITQLADCGRVSDFQGASLDLDTLKAVLYSLKRNRQVGGAVIRRIDAMTDRFTADSIAQVLISYYQKKYNVQYTRYFEGNQQITFGDQVMWDYNLYKFPDEGVELCVIVDEFFDDRISASPTSDANVARELWLLDWSDTLLGIAGTASATRQTNVLDNLYNCVITPNVNHYQLNSETICPMIQDANRHAVFTNFNAGCPIITSDTCVAYS